MKIKLVPSQCEPNKQRSTVRPKRISLFGEDHKFVTKDNYVKV